MHRGCVYVVGCALKQECVARSSCTVSDIHVECRVCSGCIHVCKCMCVTRECVQGSDKECGYIVGVLKESCNC